jgi:hypothetical protein
MKLLDASGAEQLPGTQEPAGVRSRSTWIHWIGSGFSAEMQETSKCPSMMRKLAAHWRRVAQLVTDAFVEKALCARASDLEVQAEEIERRSRSADKSRPTKAG